MNTDTLRETAKLIRDRAQHATPGEWYADGTEGVYAYGAPGQPDCPTVIGLGGASPGDITHIAGWGPEVAVAVADLLDHAAQDAEERGTDVADDNPLLAVARTYLAPTSVHT